MKQNLPGCKIVNMTQRVVDTLVCSWFNSRDFRMPGEPWTLANINERLENELNSYIQDQSSFFILKNLLGEKFQEPNVPHDQSYAGEYVDKMKNLLFYSIIEIDIPLLEFITFNLTFYNVPRSFVDQLDRTRNAAFWEQSIRVKDLTKFADCEEYFVPPDLIANPDTDVAKIYHVAMKDAQLNYARLIKAGLRPEQARGVAPLHVNTRADVSVNMRTLIGLFKKRICFFSQGEYWRPVIQEFFNELFTSELSDFRELDREKIMKMFGKLPCDGNDKCPYFRDVVDRLVDKSNPICPILFLRFMDDDLKKKTVWTMHELYTIEGWKAFCDKYMKSIGRDYKKLDSEIERLR